MSKKGINLPKEIQSELRSIGIDELKISKVEQRLNRFLILMNSKASDEVILSSIQDILGRLQGDLQSMELDRNTHAEIQQKLNLLQSFLQNTDQATILETIGKLRQMDLQKQGNMKTLANLIKKL